MGDISVEDHLEAGEAVVAQGAVVQDAVLVNFSPSLLPSAISFTVRSNGTIFGLLLVEQIRSGQSLEMIEIRKTTTERERGATNPDSDLLREWGDVHVVIQDDGARRLHVPLDALALHEDHLGVVVRIRAHLELAHLKGE